MRRSLWRIRSAGGYSLLEVLISLFILMFGILGILAYFPSALRANDRAILLSEAVLLAQRKAEEIRRDDTVQRKLIRQIRDLTEPTAPVVYDRNPTLAYRFCGVSLLDPVDDPGDPRDDRGVARVIVEYAPGHRRAGTILYELRFDE
jgi:type II secretory pathway pseudopilin PulG